MTPTTHEFEAALTAAYRTVGQYRASLAGLPVIPAQAAPAPIPLPSHGIGVPAAIEEFTSAWVPAMTASAGPRYLGYVVGGSTPAAVAGDWISAGLDQNVASNEGGAGDLEQQTLQWLRGLLNLAADLQGVMVTGATMANTTGLAVAREWAGRELGITVNRTGTAGLGRLSILAGTPHSSIPKALSVLGLGRDRMQLMPTRSGRECLDLDALRDTLRSLDGPTILVAAAGTVNTADFDDLRGLLRLREEFHFWLHVDAAFGAFAALDPRTASLVDGLGEADSVAVDLHKWLNVPYDSGVVYTRRPDFQLDTFHNASSYLNPPGTTPDFLHLGPENSRRLRALPAWMALRAYGRKGHEAIVVRCNTNARLFARLVADIPGVRLLAPVRLNVACFSVPAPTRPVLDAVARSGVAFLTPTRHLGCDAIRAAFSNWSTTPEDVVAVAAALREALSR